MLIAQLSLILCYPMNCSLPGSSIHGIFQARTLEWVAITLGGGLKKILPWFLSKSVVPMFFSKSFIVSGFTLRSLINFEFIFVYDTIEYYNFILSSINVAVIIPICIDNCIIGTKKPFSKSCLLTYLGYCTLA